MLWRYKNDVGVYPKIDPAFGQEYCRANIDAHFGTYDFIDDEGNVKGFGSEVPLDKNGIKDMRKSK